MRATLSWPKCVNTLRPRQNGRHFADDICKCIFLNENVRIPIKSSLKFVPKGPINNIPSLVQIMAWRRPGDKPLSEPMIVTLLTHICITRPQWVKTGSEDMHNQYPDYWCLETKQWWLLNYMNNFFFEHFLHVNDLWNWWSVAMGKWFYPTLYNGCNYLSMLVLQLIYASKQDTGLVLPQLQSFMHMHFWTLIISHILSLTRLLYLIWPTRSSEIYQLTFHGVKTTPMKNWFPLNIKMPPQHQN